MLNAQIADAEPTAAPDAETVATYGNFAKMLKCIVDATPLALNLWDSDMNNVACNRQVLSIFDIDSEEEYLKNFYKFSPEYQPNGMLSSDMARLNFEKALRDGSHRFKWMHIDGTGNEIPAEITLAKVNIVEGTDHVVGFVRDLRSEYEHHVEREDDYYFIDKVPVKAFLSKVAEISDDLFFTIDRRSKKIQYLTHGYNSQASEKLFISASTSAYNESVVHSDDVEIYKKLVHNMSIGVIKPMELRFLQPDRRYKCYRIIYRFIYDKHGAPIIVVGKGINVGEQKALEEQIKYDALTRCYSKANAEKIIEDRMQKSSSDKGALLFVDINAFKAFNEDSGHFYGDEMLRQLATRLQEWSGERDVVGRIGGDEFVVYVNDGDDSDTFFTRMDDLKNRLNSSYDIFGLRIDMKVSIGVSLLKHAERQYERCIKYADKALAVSKAKGNADWLLYDDTLKDYDVSVLAKEAKSEKISGIKLDHAVILSVFNILYERNSDITAINSALRYLGQSYNVSRCFIVETFDGGTTYEFTHEWCKTGIKSHLKSDTIVSQEFLSSLFTSTTLNGMCLCNDVANSDLNETFKQKITQTSTKAFLHSQVKKDDVVTFFIGLEDCANTRVWADTEANTVHYLSRILSILLQGRHLHEAVKVLSEYNKVSAFIADNTDNFIYIVDPDTYSILHMNKKALHMYNNPPEEVWRNAKCYELLHNKTRPCEFCTNNQVTQEKFYEWNYYNPRFDKTYLFKDKLVPLNGKLVKLQVATDITTIVALESELTDKLLEQDLLLECIKILHTSEPPDVSIKKILGIVCDFFGASRSVILQVAQDGATVNNTHEWTNASTAPNKHRLQGLKFDVLQPFFDKFLQNDATYTADILASFKDFEDLREIIKAQRALGVISAPIKNADGDFIGIYNVDNPTKNVDKYWLLGSLSVFVSDFLEKNKLISSLNELSYYDTLTGIKNRHSYRKALEEIDSSKVVSLGVAYIDITALSRINEEKGTRYGDEMIKRMSGILTGIFGEDTYHVGGDEFVILDKNTPETAFEHKISLLKSTIYKENELNASIGYTWNTGLVDDELDDDEYNTVRDRKSYTAMLSKNLENEIKRGKYVVYLQSQINLQTDKLDGAEALIRRLDASGNMQSPALFVPFYEKEGMISLIDFYVFETVCRLLNQWGDSGINTSIKFSVNFSRMTVMEKDLVARLTDICERYGVDKSMFIVEITETISHSDDKVFASIISSLKNAGFCVSLDDFGSGHANLTALKVSDFDEIKIDMGLTRDLHIENKSKTLAKVALNLCDELEGVISVAEGIETVEQRNILKDLGCNKGQGYYFSKPISISDFETKYFKNGGTDH